MGQQRTVSSALALYHDLTGGFKMESEDKKPGNYLSIDGGLTPACGLCALYILNEMFERLQWDLKMETMSLPCELFDMIIGAGYGGLVVLLLGPLHLSPPEAIEAYEKLIPALSVSPATDEEERKNNTNAFEIAFSEVLVHAGFQIDAPLLDKDALKTILCTQRTSAAATPYLLRSYPSRGSRPPQCTILQAACATVASLDKFIPTTLGVSHSRIDLTDAIIGYANPTQVLFREAQNVFGEASKVATIISVGLGRTKVSAIQNSSQEGIVTERLKQVLVNCEQVHQELSGRLNETGVYFRFNPDQALDINESVLSNTSAYLDDEATNNRLDKATKSIRSRADTIELKDINSATVLTIALKPRPSLSPNFVGREDILESMRRRHFGDRPPNPHLPAISVLIGLGGSGKTQTALKFALEYESRHLDGLVYFFDGSSEDKLKADFALAIRARGTAYRSQSHDDSLTWFATRMDDWLIIIDNADDPSIELFRFIPKSSRGNVIITTRNATYKTLAPNGSHHVEGLSSSDAIALILNGSSYAANEVNRAYAQAIAKELGYLPLALAHAAAYISIHQCLPTYLAMYQKSQAKFLALKQTLPEDYSLSVTTTIQMALNSGSITPAARDVMALFARFDASMIAHSIIATSAEQYFDEIDGQVEDETIDPQTIEHADTLMDIFCPSGEWSEYDFNDIIQQCMQYSLLQVTSQGEAKFYSMHVLVQTYLQSNSDSIRTHQAGRLVGRLLGSAITIHYDYEYQPFNRLLTPHLRAVAVGDVVEAGDHAGFGQVLLEQGSPQLSAAHFERCLELRKHSLGDNHRDTVRIMANLALSYSEMGRHREALDLQEMVLRQWMHIAGGEDLETVRAMVSLAVSYDEMGRYQEALDLKERAAVLQKRILGDEHPETLRAVANLAVSYDEVGKHQKALALKEEVLTLWKQTMGDENINTLIAMGNLAVSYHNIGKHQEALDLKEMVLVLWKRISGDEHPDTIYAMGNVAASYYELGRYQEALDLGEKVLALRKKLSGDDCIAFAMGNLARVYSAMGRYREALDLEEQALELQKHTLGDEHPNTLIVMANLARTYSELGRYQEVVDLEEKVLELRTRILGDEHPDTLVVMGNLAATYQALGRNQEALNLEERVLKLRIQILGDEHPDTLLAMGNIALTYSEMGRNKEALDIEERVLELRARISGDEHPDTLRAIDNLASSYSQLGRNQEALDLKEKVLELRTRISGDEHPDTLLAMSNLAVTLNDLGMVDRATSLLQAALPLHEKVRGADHPETASVREFLEDLMDEDITQDTEMA